MVVIFLTVTSLTSVSRLWSQGSEGYKVTSPMSFYPITTLPVRNHMKRIQNFNNLNQTTELNEISKLLCVYVLSDGIERKYVLSQMGKH